MLILTVKISMRVNFLLIFVNKLAHDLLQRYPRPGKIINQGLIKEDHLRQEGLDSHNIELKPDILERHDFEAVSREVFEMLAGIYGCDYKIIRLLRPDPSHANKMYLDLFPSKLKNNAH